MPVIISSYPRPAIKYETFSPYYGRKDVARIRLPDGTIARAEVHWYEAHGVGRCELKIKRLLSEEP
jgi:hypothetical protein